MRRAAAALLVSMALTGCAGYRASRARSRVPRVVFISIDTLHVNWIGPYNSEVETTPYLDAFAREGVRFEYAYTHTPITLPSHASLMTGKSPPTLGVMANGDKIPDEERMLAEILKDSGYRTAGFISLGVLQPLFGMDQGFEHFPFPFDDGPTRWYRNADEIFDPMKDWVEANKDAPFFLWAHFSDPHEPYVTADAGPDTELRLDGELVGRYNVGSAETHAVRIELAPGKHRLEWVSLWEAHEDDRPESGIELMLVSHDGLSELTETALPPAEFPLQPSYHVDLNNDDDNPAVVEFSFAGRVARPPPSVVLSAYEQNIAYTDRYLQKLDDVFESLGIRDETLFVIVSDHGEGLFAHDVIGHATHVYEDQLRIVWMMRGGGLPENKVIDDRPGLMTDVTPTVLDVLGLPHGGMEGRSWLECLSGGTCPESDPWWSFGLSHATRGLTGMASYRWPHKWIWRRGFRRIAFDVTSDPWEEADLLASPGPHNPLPLKESAESFRAERRRLARVLRESQKRESNENEDLLKSLGYIGGLESNDDDNSKGEKNPF